MSMSLQQSRRDLRAVDFWTNSYSLKLLFDDLKRYHQLRLVPSDPAQYHWALPHQLKPWPTQNMASVVMVVPGGSYVDLAICRSLGRAGHTVFVGECPQYGATAWSRYCSAGLRLSGNPATAAAEILEYAAQHGITHLICTEEEWIIHLNEHREKLERQLCPMFPDAERFELAMHKDRTLALAARLGIPAPRTVVLQSAADLDQCRNLQFPLVLKPRHRDPRIIVKSSDFVARYVTDFDQLSHEVEKCLQYGDYPLVQEYIPGHGVGVEVLMRNGEPVVLFQHERLREYPPSGGRSVYCRSVALDETLCSQAVALLRAMSWDGIAMVEYRYDAATGRYGLMEVNGRFWGSLALAIHSGADFPAAWLASLAGSDPRCHITPGIYCRLLGHDTRWLMTELRHPRGSRLAALRQYLSAFRPGVRYYVWDWKDPLPAFASVALRASRAFSGLLLRFSASKNSAHPNPNSTTGESLNNA